MKATFWAVSLAAVLLTDSLFALNIAIVPVGNPGNPGDPDTSGYGSVDYEYRIGKYEVTNLQYVEFLNAVVPTGVSTLGLYNSSMSSSPAVASFSTAAPRTV